MLSLVKMIQQQQHLDNMEAHQERVITEKKELDIKIKGLQKFVEAENFTTIVPVMEEQRDLREQLRIMVNYTQVLSSRINRF